MEKPRCQWFIVGMAPRRKRQPAQSILAENLLRLRGELGMSQRDLAAASGVRQALVSDIELGRANPTLSSLDAIADALGIELGHLFRSAPD